MLQPPPWGRQPWPQASRGPPWCRGRRRWSDRPSPAPRTFPGRRPPGRSRGSTSALDQWIGFVGKIYRKAMLNGNIYGFRFRFSLKPIHWLEDFRAFFLLNRGTSPGKIGKMWADLRGLTLWKLRFRPQKLVRKTLEWIFARCKCRFKEQN